MERLVGHVGHRLDPWQGRLMSSVARLILTNSSLASLPIYTMSLFLLAEGMDAGFDTTYGTLLLGGSRREKEVSLSELASSLPPKGPGWASH